ncbi:hypothetical protein ACJMK2_041389 [Sinanodonta woodiana]|uniref:Uncharacterized protein n=1 Tax=Sinanodonta woodiana TaxID=1069815 RepID=A0ABD3W7A8_SINWO
MKHFLIFLLCTVKCSKYGETSSYLMDRTRDGDINDLRLRLSKEGERRLLLEKDVTLLSRRYAQQHRLLFETFSVIKTFFFFICSIMTPVGFVAKLSALTTTQNGDVLKLDKVDMNETNGYIPAIGVFSAPVECLPVHIVLMNGYKELTRLFAGDIASSRMVWAVSVPAILNENDNIFIKAIVSHAGFNGQYFTSFSGVLI